MTKYMNLGPYKECILYTAKNDFILWLLANSSTGSDIWKAVLHPEKVFIMMSRDARREPLQEMSVIYM